MRPAIVRYIGDSNNKFTAGNYYEAFFIEYWQGERTSLHVRGNDGKVTDFNYLDDFEIISDESNLLNTYEAIVRCKTHKYDDLVTGLTFGKEYKAIGCDKDGLFLIMDDSLDCYFYPPEVFEIVEDNHNILSRRSVYYSYYSGDEIVKE